MVEKCTVDLVAQPWSWSLQNRYGVQQRQKYGLIARFSVLTIRCSNGRSSEVTELKVTSPNKMPQSTEFNRTTSEDREMDRGLA